MLGTEAAAVFDELTRKHITEGLNSWPDTFRQGQFVPAVEYLRAARVRTLLMRAMAERMATVDLYVGRAGPVDHQPDRPPDRRLPRSASATATAAPCPARSPSPAGSTTSRPSWPSPTPIQQAAGDHLSPPPLERFLAEDGASGDERDRPRSGAGG